MSHVFHGGLRERPAQDLRSLRSPWSGTFATEGPEAAVGVWPPLHHTFTSVNVHEKRPALVHALELVESVATREFTCATRHLEHRCPVALNTFPRLRRFLEVGVVAAL